MAIPLGLISGLVSLAVKVMTLFEKSPEQREREKIKKEQDKAIKISREVSSAIDKARDGRTGDLERQLGS